MIRPCGSSSRTSPRATRTCVSEPAAAGIEHLVALIRPDNIPSQGVALNLGMELERTAFVHGTVPCS